MKKTKLIIAREFNERVRKKSFIITTLLMPVLMVALMVAPSLIALYGGGQKRIVVVDRSGFVSPRLVSGGDILFEDQSQLTKTEACSRYNEDSGAYGILYIG
ncbi:MAG: ABC transporter permease, partial [Alistipes sp.]|nr:ABC transporter permease [Alistipes sp.]